MGRKKKQAFVSYVDILISTYVKKGEYERAQLKYSNNLSSKKYDYGFTPEENDFVIDVDDDIEGD